MNSNLTIKYAGKLKKNHNEFSFEKEITLDRYLLENKKKIKETSKIEDVKSLKTKEKNTESELKSLQKFDDQGNSVEHFLRHSVKFLKSQLKDLKENDFVDIDTVKKFCINQPRAYQSDLSLEKLTRSLYHPTTRKNWKQLLRPFQSFNPRFTTELKNFKIESKRLL